MPPLRTNTGQREFSLLLLHPIHSSAAPRRDQFPSPQRMKTNTNLLSVRSEGRGIRSLRKCGKTVIQKTWESI